MRVSVNPCRRSWNAYFFKQRNGLRSSIVLREGEVGPDGLSRREHDILAFERQWWKYAGAKEEAIKELFGLSATRYYQVLNALINNPAALSEDPMLIKRLRRLRDQRQRTRSARRLGFEV